jgi:hypothetical protein
MGTDFDKYHNLSKRNVKLILKVLSDLEPLRGSSNKKTLYSTRSCVNWAFFGTRGPLTQTRQINYYNRLIVFCYDSDGYSYKTKYNIYQINKAKYLFLQATVKQPNLNFSSAARYK